jgi:hypothetical protein
LLHFYVAHPPATASGPKSPTHNAIYHTYAERDRLTGDVGGNSSTNEFTGVA